MRIKPRTKQYWVWSKSHAHYGKDSTLRRHAPKGWTCFTGALWTKSYAHALRQYNRLPKPKTLEIIAVDKADRRRYGTILKEEK